jgi:zinc transporter ZupT
MSAVAWVLVITALAGVGGTGLGGAVSASFRRGSDRIVSLLLSFAGGVMLAVVCFDLIMGALYPETGANGVGVWFVYLRRHAWLRCYLCPELSDRQEHQP